MNCILKLWGAALLLALPWVGYSQTLDYGAVPALTQPLGDQAAANQKLDYHTDLYTGRFNYTVPIEVPPGRGGSEPSVALQYNSSDGNGWCGVGWDLDLGYIQRETRKGVPLTNSAYYSDSYGFIYSVAGKSGRLVKAGDGTYRPEINTAFLKFIPTNSYWLVIDKDGRQYTFGGGTTNQIIGPSGQPTLAGTFKWMLSAIQDANGNRTVIAYQTSGLGDNQLYLSQISYNANTNNSLSANCTVSFSLTSRSDVPSSCLSGATISTAKLLQHIKVYCNSSLVRDYLLHYTASPSTGRSLLDSVTEYGSDDVTAWPAMTFNYSALSKSFGAVQRWPITSQAATNGSALLTSPSTMYTALIDMNGDGLPDWVSSQYGGSSFTYYIVQTNNGHGFGPAHNWTVDNEVHSNGFFWNVVNWSYSAASYTLIGGTASSCQLVDINGDGLPDRVMSPASTSSTYFQVQTNTGTGFGPVQDWNNVGTNDVTLTPTWNAPGVSMYDPGSDAEVMLIDMNGDGIADLVELGSTTNKFPVQINNAPGTKSFQNAIPWQGVGDTNGLRLQYQNEGILSDFMDMNGDGLPDRIVRGGVQLNLGAYGTGYPSHGLFDTTQSWGMTNNESFAVSDSTRTYFKQLIDINGDGLPDMVISTNIIYSNFVTHASYLVRYNTGSGFSSTPVVWTGVDTTAGDTYGMQSWDSVSTIATFMDMNGDGLPDRVVRNNQGGSDCLLVQLNNGPFPDLLTSAQNGMGGEVDVTYTNSSIFDNSDGSHPRLPFPQHVVTSVIEDGNMGPAITNLYTYAYGYYDRTWREFRGFGMVTESLPTGMGDFYTNVTYFYQGGGRDLSANGEYQDTRFKAGMAFDVITYGSDGNQYKETLSQITQVEVDTNGIYFPFATNVFEFDTEPSANARATLKQYTYDVTSNNLAASTGNLLKEADLGEVTNVTYSFTYTDVPDSPVYTTYTYATLSNPNIIDKPATVTVSSDAAGVNVLRKTQYQYFGATGNVQEKSEMACSSSYANTFYAYDVYGNELTATNPVGVVTATSYDSASETFAWRTVTGTLTNLTLYDPNTGFVLLATNEQGLVTSNSYDALWRPSQTYISTTPYGAATLQRTGYSYVTTTTPIYVILWKNDPVSSTGFHETITYLDGLGRPIQVLDQSETNGSFRVSSVAYDPHGEVMAQTYPFYSSLSSYYYLGGSVYGMCNQYDAIGRLASFSPVALSFWGSGIPTSYPSPQTGDTGSPSGATLIDYGDGSNPWAVVVTDARSKVHKYLLDSFGRTNQIVEVTSSGNYTTKLAYNQVGDLTNIMDNASNSIGMTYDMLGQRVAVADPDMGLWQYDYDLAGRLNTQTDARGQQIKCYYSDAAGRLTRREGWNGTNCVSTNTWAYDSNGGDTSCTVYPGQLYQVVDDQGWQKFSYDVRGRTIKAVRYLSQNGRTYTNQYTFDDVDRLTSTVYPNGGPVITNRYDAGEHLQQVALGSTNFYTARSFDDLNRLTTLAFGNGVTTTCGYYPTTKRLKQIITAKTVNLQNLTYSYDADGNIAGVTDGVYSGLASGTVGRLQYDDLNRLLSLTNASGTYSYGYNAIGNVLTNKETGSGTYVYSSTIRPHCVQNANGMWYTYDQNGNAVFRSGQRLDYDVNNRLYRVLNTNGTATYFGYDANGARLWEQAGTNALQVWIDGDYEEKQGQVLYHVSAGGRLVATFDQTGTNVYQYYHQDDLTSTSIQTDQNGNQVQNYGYTAYGQSRYTQNTNLFKVSRRYTGQVLDDVTGLYYYNARYYDPELGRFIQPDDRIPDLSNPQSYNRYSYCINNPLRYTDPDGRAPSDWANSWSGQINAGAGVISAGSSHWIWNGTVGTIQSLGNGIPDALRFGSTAGALSGSEHVTAGQVAIGTVQEVGRAATLVPVGAAIGKGAGTVVGALAGSAESQAAGELAGAAGKVAGGNQQGSLTAGQAQKIQGFADKYNTPVNVVGSRAAGTASEASDFDYVIGGVSKTRQAARRELPRGQAGGEISPSGHETGIDVFNGNKTPLDPNRPHVTFEPKPKSDQ